MLHKSSMVKVKVAGKSSVKITKTSHPTITCTKPKTKSWLKKPETTKTMEVKAKNSAPSASTNTSEMMVKNTVLTTPLMKVASYQR